MESEATKQTPILEMAWQRHADLDLAADKRSKGFYSIRRWIAGLGILATFFAILVQRFVPELVPTSLEGWVIKVLFIAIPIITSAFAAFATKFYSNGSWLIYRAAAEEVKKEIYIYRTILPRDKSRRDYLERRLGEIQRKVFRNLGGEYALERYEGLLPSSYRKNKQRGDPGFHDLNGDEYVEFRLKHQLDWHNNKILQRGRERWLMTIAILAVGVAGAFLAALGGPLAIWVAFTASITAALLGWQELKKVDETIKNYSKVVLELGILYEHWRNVVPAELKPEELALEFQKTVLSCERVLWTQNREYIRSMQEALREADLEKDAAFIKEVIKESAESAERAKEKMYDNIIDLHQETLLSTEQSFDESTTTVLGTLAEEAASEIVQQELAAMGEAISERIEDARERASTFVASITQVKEEFAHVDVSKDTPTEELNDILSRYPTTNEVKG